MITEDEAVTNCKRCVEPPAIIGNAVEKLALFAEVPCEDLAGAEAE